MERQSDPDLTLYTRPGCPYCQLVEGALSRLGIRAEQHDIVAEPEAAQHLRAARGQTTVPALRVEEGGQVSWLADPDEIVAYLRRLKGLPGDPAPPRPPRVDGLLLAGAGTLGVGLLLEGDRAEGLLILGGLLASAALVRRLILR